MNTCIDVAQIRTNAEAYYRNDDFYCSEGKNSLIVEKYMHLRIDV
ncbi:hypothetical protein [Pelosinus sp. IPA-1]|nr:hypothetical protein [Pelosinus sp. IPA-1]GMA99544.1 hypothetical protein PIPA1_23440 [Pelosinus sp. IPA-1]